MRSQRLNDAVHASENTPYKRGIAPQYTPETQRQDRIPCLNKTGDNLYIGQLVVSNGVFDLTYTAWEVIVPTADSMPNALIVGGNGEDDDGIPNNSIFYCTRSPTTPHYVQTSDSPDSFSPGDTLGTKAGSLLAALGNTGLIYMGVSDNDDILPGDGVRACLGGGGGGSATLQIMQVKEVDSSAGTCKISAVSLVPDETPNFTSSDDEGDWQEVYYLRS